ncbi:glycosyltransferase [Flavobacterium zhairuonense]|uniref:glycosyltransferase n=1 Tax=Flavobacterium zhairuonense TaxID=2493631 RepID=UPI001042D81A|nr:glycosyltransferase [Flavobacterium zhairuonense]KAF2510807.1 glycosyltransferase [Flavobacterium zhairuonense]
MRLAGKRILLVLHQGALGGAERQALGLGKYLSKEYNCNVDLLLTFSSETTAEFDDYVKECGINNVLYFGPPYLILKKEFSILNIKRLKWSIEYLIRLRKEVKKYNPEIIIPFLNFPSKISYYLYKLIPSVKFTFWHQLGLDTLSLDIFEKIAVNNIPLVIGNASNCLEMFTSPYSINREKLNILPQYLSLTKEIGDKKLLRRKYNIQENAIVIGMVAHYREEKFHELLLQSFIKLNEIHKNIHLVFLGNRFNTSATQTKFDNLLNIVKNNCLENNVSLLSEEKVTDILSCIDIGVLVSRIEGMPNAVMEYMLYGLPVITTNHPGCVQLLGESEFLIDNNEEILFEKLNKLIASDSLRKIEGDLNLMKIKKYDVESYVHRLEKIISKKMKN